MSKLNFSFKLKQYLKKSPFLRKIKHRLRRLLGTSQRLPILASEDYFPKLFANSPNLKSLGFEKGLVAGSFRGTSYLLNIRPQNLIESYVYLHGIWEPHIAELIASYLNDSQVAVIDVGANIGATSIPLAKHFVHTQFFLFEPHPIIFKDLKNNISFNKLENIHAYNIAITSGSNQFLPFYAQKNAKNFGLSSLNLNHDIKEYDVVKVECKTLDSMFNEDLKIKIIKIDTQGNELNVLLSARSIIQKHRPVIFFEFESEYFKLDKDENETKERMLKFFKELDYELYPIEANNKFFPQLTFQGYFHGDILAVPLHKDHLVDAPAA